MKEMVVDGVKIKFESDIVRISLNDWNVGIYIIYQNVLRTTFNRPLTLNECKLLNNIIENTCFPLIQTETKSIYHSGGVSTISWKCVKCTGLHVHNFLQESDKGKIIYSMFPMPEIPNKVMQVCVSLLCKDKINKLETLLEKYKIDNSQPSTTKYNKSNKRAFTAGLCLGKAIKHE